MIDFFGLQLGHLEVKSALLRGYLIVRRREIIMGPRHLLGMWDSSSGQWGEGKKRATFATSETSAGGSPTISSSIQRLHQQHDDFEAEQ
jgi:hypothetical protein